MWPALTPTLARKTAILSIVPEFLALGGDAAAVHHVGLLCAALVRGAAPVRATVATISHCPAAVGA